MLIKNQLNNSIKGTFTSLLFMQVSFIFFMS